MMNKVKLVTALLAVAVLSAVLQGCSDGPPAPPERASVNVKTWVVEPADVPDYIRAVGTVEAVHEAVLSTKLMGRIETITVDEGDRVSRGQTVAVVEASDVRAQKSQAVSAKAEGEAGLIEAKAALANAETNVSRMRALYDEGAVTKKELDDTVTHRDMMLAKVAQVEAKIAQAEAAVGQADSALGYAVIKSPVDGYVVARMMDPGDMAVPGLPVLKVADTAYLRVSATINEGVSVFMEEGLDCEVRIDALGRRLNCVVSEVVPVADPMTRSVTVKLSVPETEGLRPGMFARVMIPSGSRMAIAVPESVIVKLESVEGVYILIDGYVSFQPVRVGENANGFIEILSGLTGGESLIVSDTAGLTDGMKAVVE